MLSLKSWIKLLRPCPSELLDVNMTSVIHVFFGHHLVTREFPLVDLKGK